MKIRSVNEQNKINIPISDLDCGFGKTHTLRIRKFINTFCYPQIYRLLVPEFVYEQALGLRKLNKSFYFVWGWLSETGHAERLFGKSVSAAINSITVAKVMDSS